MTIARHRFMSLLVACGLLMPHVGFTQLVLVGLSPGKLVLTILKNSQEVRAFQLTRPDTTRDEPYQVTVGGEAASAILLPRQSFVFPKGQDQIAYSFTVNTNNVGLGHHEAFVNFTPTAWQGGRINGVKTQFVLSGRVLFDVIETVPEKKERRDPLSRIFLMLSVIVAGAFLITYARRRISSGHL